MLLDKCKWVQLCAHGRQQEPGLVLNSAVVDVSVCCSLFTLQCPRAELLCGGGISIFSCTCECWRTQVKPLQTQSLGLFKFAEIKVCLLVRSNLLLCALYWAMFSSAYRKSELHKCSYVQVNFWLGFSPFPGLSLSLRFTHSPTSEAEPTTNKQWPSQPEHLLNTRLSNSKG